MRAYVIDVVCDFVDIDSTILSSHDRDHKFEPCAAHHFALKFNKIQTYQGSKIIQ